MQKQLVINNNNIGHILMALESYFLLIKRNVMLDRLLNSDIVKQTESMLKRAIKKQIKLLNKNNIAEYLASDNYKDKIKHDFISIEAYLDRRAIDKMLIYSANRGGQNALNKIYNYYKRKKFAKAFKLPPQFNLVNYGLLKELENRTGYIIDSVNRTTLDIIINRMTEGVEEGLSVDDIARRINKDVEDMSEYRAERIVRTEASNASNRMEMETTKQLGIARHAWITSGDDRVAQICLDNESQGYIGVGQNFDSGDTHPPSHPNCRCWLDPEIPDNFNLDNAILWTGE